MTTAIMEIGAAQEAIASTMAAAGYPEQAISKVLKVLRNRAPSRAPARTHADTHTHTDSIPDREDEDGVMLDLSTKTPPSWVQDAIKESLEARGIAATHWARAWRFFASWNRHGRKNASIPMRALRGWLKTCKLGIEAAARATRKPAAKPPAPRRPDQELWDHCVRKNWELSLALKGKIGPEEFEKRIETELKNGAPDRLQATVLMCMAACKQGLL